MSDHMHIARERFLDLMAGGESDPGIAAAMAIEDADIFMETYRAKIGYIPSHMVAIPTLTKLKGCKACHGSGGKRNNPCEACCGTGKVAT